MTRISLVVSDVDGTLVTSDKRITPAAHAAVNALRESGIRFTITSSRPAFGLRSLVEALDLDLPIGPFNGSSLVNPDLSVIEQHVIPRAAVQRSLAMFAERRIDAWIFTASAWLIQRREDQYVPREIKAIATEPLHVTDFGDAIGAACKVVGVSGDRALLEACERDLGAELGAIAHVARSQHYYLDVTPPGFDKGTFVTSLGKRLGIPREEIATIGDMPNDVPMFAVSGFSVAMGNASDAVKARATTVTDVNDSDGFANAMQRLLEAQS